MTIGAKVIIHKPPFRFFDKPKDVIAQKTQEIKTLASSPTADKPPTLTELLDEKNFYTFEHLLLIFDFHLKNKRLKKFKKIGIPDPMISGIDNKLEKEKFGDNDLEDLKIIFVTLEKVAHKLSVQEMGYLFLHYIEFTDPKSILLCLQDYPKLMGRLSCEQLFEFATLYKTPEVAEYMLADPQYSRILSQDNYSRHKIYRTYPDNLFLADQAASVFDIKRIYTHDNSEQNEDRRDIPDNFKEINDKHSNKENLIREINQLQQEITKTEGVIKGWEELPKALKQKNEDKLSRIRTLLGIQGEFTIDPKYIKSQIITAKRNKRSKKAELNQKKIALESLRTEIMALSQDEEFVMGKRALDIFLRKQSTDKEKEKSHANMRTLIKLTPKYCSLVDERHIEAMFALAKTEGEFIAVLHYLTRDNSTKTYLINCLELLLDPRKNENSFSPIQSAAKKNIWQYIESGSLLRVESTSYLKFYVKHPDVMKAIFENAPDKFADSLVEKLSADSETSDSETSVINISERYVRELLKANAHWLTAEHFIEINKRIINDERNGHHNRKVIWHNYLKRFGLAKLRQYIKKSINDTTNNTVSGVKNTKLSALLETIKNYPDFRGWLAIGNIEKGLINKWISCTNQDPELCRLVALDSHLFQSYSDNQPKAANNIYLAAREKFEYNVANHRGFFSDFLDSVKNTVKSIVNVSSTYEIFMANQSGTNQWSQETAFILAERHWNSIQPVRRANESSEDFGERKKTFYQQSPFFEAKITNKRLIEIAMSQLSAKETKLEALRMLSKSELLFAETLRSAINGEDELIELADIIRQITVSDNSDEAKKDKNDKEKLLKTLDDKLVAGLLSCLESDTKYPSQTVQKLAGSILEKVQNPVDLIKLAKKFEKLTEFKKSVDKALLSKLQAYSKIAIKDDYSNALNTEDNASYLMSILPQASLQQLMEIEKTVKKIYGEEETLKKIRQKIQKTMILKLVDKEKLDSNDSPTEAVKINQKKSEKKKVKEIDLSLDNGSGVSASDEEQKLKRKENRKLMKASLSGSEGRSESEIESWQEDTASTTFSTSSTSTTSTGSEVSEIEIDGIQPPQSASKDTELLTYIKTALLTDKNCTLEQLKAIYLNYEELRKHVKSIIVKKLLAETDLAKVRDFILSFKPEEQAILSDIFKDNTALAKKIFDSISDNLMADNQFLVLGQFLDANPEVLANIYHMMNNAENSEIINKHKKLILFLSNIQNLRNIDQDAEPEDEEDNIYLNFNLLTNPKRLKDIGVILFESEQERYNTLADIFIPKITDNAQKAEFVTYMLNSNVWTKEGNSDFLQNAQIKEVMLKKIFIDLNFLSKIQVRTLNELVNNNSAKLMFGVATDHVDYNEIRKTYPQFGFEPVGASSPKKSSPRKVKHNAYSAIVINLAEASNSAPMPASSSSQISSVPQAGGSGSVLNTAHAESGVASSSSSSSSKTHLTTAGTFQQLSGKGAETRSKNALKLEKGRTRSASQ